MKNKKGFTLIELLSVIVILAIIALIAVPVVLNIVKNAKERGAIASTYGYIDAVNSYQEWNEFEGKDVLEAGTYNVAIKTDSINKINDLVKLKGSKPTAGKIEISSSHQVAGALLCYNNFIVRYLNSKAEIEGSNCDEMDLITSIAAEAEGWQSSRSLTIDYPKGDYKYYFKVSGAVVMTESNQTVEVNKDLETTNPLKITLKENQILTTWVVRNGNQLGKSEYNEEQIDTVQPLTPEAVGTTGYPVITDSGIKTQVLLEINNYNKQEGSSAYYNVDNGEWIKYTGSVNLLSSNIKVKIERDKSGFSSEKTPTFKSNVTNALSSNAYKGDGSSSEKINKGSKLIKIDESMYGKSVEVKYHNYSFYVSDGAANNYIKVYDKNNQVKKTITYNYNNDGDYTNVIDIKENYDRIVFESGSNSSSYITVKNVAVYLIPYIGEEGGLVYPIIKASGIERGYRNYKIIYPNLLKTKQYKINSSDWTNYTDSGVNLNLEDKLSAKGYTSTNVESHVREYSIPDNDNALRYPAYDNNPSSYVKVNNGSRIIKIDSSMYNKSIEIDYYNSSAYCTYNDCENHIYVYDKNNTKVKTISYTSNNSADYTSTIDIKENYDYIEFYSKSNSNYYMNIKEIKIK